VRRPASLDDEVARAAAVEQTGRAANPSLDRAPDELVVLVRVHQALSRHRDRERLLAAIAGTLHEVLPADRLAVVLGAPAGADVHLYGAHGALARHEGQRLPEGSASAWVMSSRQALWASSPEEIRERFPVTFQELADQGMRSLVVLPLRVQDRCLGTLGLLARAAGVWQGYRGRLLDEVAASIAVALDDCLAYEQHRRLAQELAALRDVNAAVGRRLERDELFGALAACLRKLLPTDYFGIELPLEGGMLQGHLLAPRGARAEPTQPTVLPAEGTACDWVLRNRTWMVGSSREELRERFPVTYEVMSREGMESLCAMPLLTGERCRGVLFFMAAAQAAYQGLRRGLLEQVASSVAVALDDCLAHEEVRRLRDRLAAENLYLQEEIRQQHNFEELVGRSPALRRALQEVELVAPTDSTVLICGETGTGKELVARAIHARSRRAHRPLIKVDCAAIPAGLVESELFGHEKGAFTGATEQRIGRFELASGGTIFLDEVGELPVETQVKLLRVLQEREFERVGGSATLKADVRVIAATNRDLLEAIGEGRFRQDLYYRLSVFPLTLPPLRERPEDIELLASYFLQRHARRVGREVSRISAASLERLRSYDWPGNVRELENTIERALILARGPVLELGEAVPVRAPEARPRLPSAPRAAAGSARAATSASRGPDPAGAGSPMTLAEVTAQHLSLALERCNGVIEGPRGAARLLGMQPSTLRSRLKKLGIKRSAGAPSLARGGPVEPSPRP
jgi:formate hydrogenlyase transcriptional activator